jgi:hypothetical protein
MRWYTAAMLAFFLPGPTDFLIIVLTAALLVWIVSLVIRRGPRPQSFFI